MLKLIINKLKYQNEYEQTSIKNTYLFEEIIKILDELIIKKLRKREVEDEDIYQDIVIKIEKVMLKFVFKNHNCHIKHILFMINYEENTLLLFYIYNLYINELELYKFINKTIDNHINDYFRSRKIRKKENTNFLKNKDDNIILLLVNKYKYSHDPKIIKMITFLQNFILKDQTRTEKEVGIILGISQQAVNKRKKKYIDKLRHL